MAVSAKIKALVLESMRKDLQAARSGLASGLRDEAGCADRTEHERSLAWHQTESSRLHAAAAERRIARYQLAGVIVGVEGQMNDEGWSEEAQMALASRIQTIRESARPLRRARPRAREL